MLLDLGSPQTIRSLHYLPAANGLIATYEVYAGKSTDQMKRIAEGEFSNIRNNPIQQDVSFPAVTARYVRLKATRMVNESETVKYEKVVVR